MFRTNSDVAETKDITEPYPTLLDNIGKGSQTTI
jgi:hypothetical protein